MKHKGETVALRTEVSRILCFCVIGFALAISTFVVC